MADVVLCFIVNRQL